MHITKANPIVLRKNTFHNQQQQKQHELNRAAMSNWTGWFFLGVVVEPKVTVHSLAIPTERMQGMPVRCGRWAGSDEDTPSGAQSLLDWC